MFRSDRIKRAVISFPPVFFTSLTLVAVKALFMRLRYGRQEVLCCLSNPQIFGGNEQQFKLISTGLKKRLLSKVVLTSGGIGGGGRNPYIPQLKKEGMGHLFMGRLHLANYSKKPFLSKCLSIIFRILQAQILCVFNPWSASLIPAAKLAGMRILYIEVGLPACDIWWEPLRPHAKDVDFVIAVSEASLRSFRREFEYKKSGIVIHALIEPPPPGLRARPPKQCELHLIYMGRMHLNKGVDKLLKAFVRVNHAYPFSRLSLIGSGVHQTIFEKQTHELGLKDKVEFLGVLDREAFFRRFADVDLFCLPSSSEGTPCSVLEAMSVGLPVISTFVGGIPELVQDGETGLLVPPGDEVALANAILKMAADPDRRFRMGMEGLKRFNSELFPDLMLEKLVSVCQTLLNNGPKA